MVRKSNKIVKLRLISGHKLPRRIRISRDKLPRRSNMSGYKLQRISNMAGDKLPRRIRISRDKLPRRIRISRDKLPKRSNMSGDKLPRRIRISHNKLPRKSMMSGDKLPRRSMMSRDKLVKRIWRSNYRMTDIINIVPDYDISPTSKVQIKAFEGDKHIPEDIKALINAFSKNNKKLDVKKELNLIMSGNVSSLKKGVKENKFLLNPNTKHILALLYYKSENLSNIPGYDDYIGQHEQYEANKTFENMCNIVVNNTAREDDLKDMIAMLNDNDRYLLSLLNNRLELVKNNIRSIQINPHIRQRDEEDATFLSTQMPIDSKRKRI